MTKTVCKTVSRNNVWPRVIILWPRDNNVWSQGGGMVVCMELSVVE